jgi:two-component system, response regulator RegA
MIDETQNQCLVSNSWPRAKTVLIVEDDQQLRQCLARALEVRGFEVRTATSVNDGLAQIELSAPEYAVVDMRLNDGCGLDVISILKQKRPDARGLILTGYGNIATAVRAVKLGAVDYLTKPADADDIASALLAPKGGKAKAPQHPMSPAHVRWEHIQQVHDSCGRNVSETSRRLNMHRRTLQRILTRRLMNEPLVEESDSSDEVATNRGNCTSR